MTKPATRTLPPLTNRVKLAGYQEAEPPPVEEPNALPRPSLPKVDIPLNVPPESGEIEVTPAGNGKISLMVRDAPLNEVLAILATQQGLNVVAAEDVTAKISVTLHDVTLDDAMSAITAVGGYTWFSRNNIVMVTKLAGEAAISPDAQGRAVQVFNLNYVTATDVEVVAKGLISPSGKLFTTLSKSDDNRRTREVVVVEDLPAYIARVADYIAQVDRPPKQVLIEGHVLQITLKDDTKHGVNWSAVASAFGGTVTASTAGFANAAASPGSFLSIDGSDVDVLLEALKTTTDAKTLAQPKVLVLNGQEAKIQIGNRFGFLVTTTTQTSTMQNVNFLNVGVLLTVTPHISDDNQVLLSVKPEVSSGQINPTTNLPDSQTTEVETTVMLPDGKGIVIGGLIKENNADSQSKVPILGDLWLAGRLFQRRIANRERVEIVIALVPRILPYPEEYAEKDAHDYMRATTPVVHPNLRTYPRPYEARLPDAMRNPRYPDVTRLPDLLDFKKPFPRPIEYYFPAVLDERPWLDEAEDYGP